MKSLVRLLAIALLTGPATLPAEAAFSSLCIFGDGVSTTTNTASAGSPYWGYRLSNGRVWVEVLAQRQGLPGNTITDINWSYSSNNWSYWGHYSSNLVQNVNNFIAPTNAATSLFVVWVNNADFVDLIFTHGPGKPGDMDLAVWTSAINLSLNNHFQVITNLYAKGARTLVMPNAVDITKVPFYANMTSSAEKDFIREMVIYFNTNFPVMLNQARALLPGLTIHMPDFFALLDDMTANPAAYGLVNPYPGAYAQQDGYTQLESGPGTNYLWWDWEDPTAKAHAIMADTAQQLISPVSIADVTLLQGSNRLDAVNLPLGLTGFVDSRTNLVAGNWLTNFSTTFNSTAATQSIFAPASNAGPFYRLRFPFAWSWP